MPFPVDNSHYDDADDYFQENSGAAKVDANVALLSRARAMLGSGRVRMLDIGAGCGESLVAAGQFGWDAVGVEPSRGFVRAGRERYNVEIELGLVEDLGLPDASFDLVLLAGVLEHVYEPSKLLEEARRVLRPGGLLYIDVPNEASLRNLVARCYLIIRGRDWSVALAPTFPPYHVVGFSPKALDFAVTHAGMTIATKRTYGLEFRADGVPTGLGGLSRGVEHLASYLDASTGIEAWARRPESGNAREPSPASSSAIA